MVTTDAVADALSALTLEEKVRLVTGQDMWRTVPVERIGLRSIVFSDGPAGVRGETWDERDPSLNLPSGTALAASWDPEVAHRYGAALAVEARRKGVDAVLGPTINLHRSPRGGRHFECMSEDPVLTASLAAAYVEGMQRNGVGATLKHYVANDSENDRFVVDVAVDERPLRELYLRAFEEAVVDAHAWLVMSAYNGVNGTTMTENALLETPLNSEWGFDGVVVSDWIAVRSLAAAHAAQDLAMPGPWGFWGDALLEAVRSGAIEEAVVDRKVERILRLAQRVGALGEAGPGPQELVEDGPTVARDVATESMVLLENRGALPWDRTAVGRVAVIGASAKDARTQGGGSATVFPKRVVSPLDGLRTALPGVEVTYSTGALVQDSLAPLPIEELTNPATGDPGARVRFLAADGSEVHVEDRRATAFVYMGGDAPIGASDRFELTTRWTPSTTGRIQLGFVAVGTGRVFANAELVVDATTEPEGTDPGAAFFTRKPATGAIETEAGVPLDVRFEFELGNREGFAAQFLACRVGTAPADPDEEALLAEAVEAARAADVAVVVVGTNEEVESEGADRTTLRLPGRQDELVAAVAAANPRTVVVVNAGSPVLMPWRGDVAALLLGWFGGQEFGTALASVLLGETEPGGRLPTTWPAREEDVPVLDTDPSGGVLRYDEGIHIGYRAWLRAGAEPAYWFGAGRGYADIALRGAQAPREAGPTGTIPVEVELENTSTRPGKEVVHVYAERPDSAVDRPVRWLVGWAPVRLGAHERVRVTIQVPVHLLAHWDGGWQLETGTYVLRVGVTAVDLPVSTEVVVG
jgi:beta-glucosidase